MKHAKINIIKYNNGFIETEDQVSIEAPLGIYVIYNNNITAKTIAVTMRTPGNDEDLALGFLLSEQIIKNNTKILSIFKKGDNKIYIQIDAVEPIDNQTLERNFYTTSSCGICGKASIEAVQQMSSIVHYPSKVIVSTSVILNLPKKISDRQQEFSKTGGIHASFLFTNNGQFLYAFEDVGRHNALDKLVGHAFAKNQLPLHNNILLLSGRASFELIQKAAIAQIPIICAFGAPSSLAIELAQEMDITLIGFLKNTSFNIYTGAEKIENINE